MERTCIERGRHPVNLWLCTGGGYDPLSNKYNLVYNRPPADEGMECDARDVLALQERVLTETATGFPPFRLRTFKDADIASYGDEQAHCRIWPGKVEAQGYFIPGAESTWDVDE